MNRTGKIIRTAAGVCVLAVILICLGISYGVSRSSRTQTLCSGISVTVADSTESRFVSAADIKEYVGRDYGKVAGIPVGNIDLDRIETILDSMSAVLKSEAYITKDGMLNISVTQRKPIMRFQKGRESFYADDMGYVFPVRSGRASYVTVIDGAVPLSLGRDGKGRSAAGKERQWLGQMTDLVLYMTRHKVWAENIVQIHVLGNGDLILIPREGKEKFLFGKPVSIEEKFRKMDAYYTNIVPARGKDCYGSVDVRFDRQIICK